MKNIFLAIVVLLVFANSVLLSEQTPLAAFKIDNIWYFLDDEGKELFPAQILDGVGYYSEGKLFVKKKQADTSYFCYYDTNGKELFKANSSIPFNFVSGRALTVKFLDEKGENRLYGYIDDQGNTLYDNVLQDGLDFSDSLAYMQQGSKRGYIGRDGKVKFYIDDLHMGYRFSEGKAPISNNDYQFAFIDKEGKIVIPFQFDEVGEFREGLCKAYKDSKFGFINHKGEFVINHEYDETRSFSEGYAFVAHYDKEFLLTWGFVNKDGRLMEDYIYKAVNDFSEGLASVHKDGKWGFIDYDGKTVIDFQFSDADSFRNGIAFVTDRANKKAGYIDKSGKFVLELKKFDILIDFRSNTRYYSFNNK